MQVDIEFRESFLHVAAELRGHWAEGREGGGEELWMWMMTSIVEIACQVSLTVINGNMLAGCSLQIAHQASWLANCHLNKVTSMMTGHWARKICLFNVFVAFFLSKEPYWRNRDAQIYFIPMTWTDFRQSVAEWGYYMTGAGDISLISCHLTTTTEQWKNKWCNKVL